MTTRLDIVCLNIVKIFPAFQGHPSCLLMSCCGQRNGVEMVMPTVSRGFKSLHVVPQFQQCLDTDFFQPGLQDKRMMFRIPVIQLT